MTKSLTRTRDNMVAGVAQGIANYLEIDVTIIRLLFVLFTLAG
ncbi:MAG: PspC domain-containing protein, partial [Chloroflexota bacterium]